MNKLLKVSASPHIKDKVTTSNLMLMVLIALAPAAIVGVINFGLHALVTLIVTTGTAVLTEYVYNRLMKKPNTIGDLSAAVTGLLLGMNLPVSLPLWMGALGSVFAIIVVKQLFGGLGQNFMNPALGARCFLIISFASYMTNFTYNGISGATPLAAIKAGESADLLSMFLGNTAGTIGETSALALLIGGLFLVFTGVIDFRTPVCYIATLVIFLLIFGGHGMDWYYIGCELCGGGLMLGAWFMATDYVTSPITKWGKVIFGVLIGILTGLFRVFGGSAEGVSYAIIFGNLLVPIIEKITLPKAFGKGGE